MLPEAKRQVSISYGLFLIEGLSSHFAQRGVPYFSPALALIIGNREPDMHGFKRRSSLVVDGLIRASSLGIARCRLAGSG